MSSSSVTCIDSNCSKAVEISDSGSVTKLINDLAHLYRLTTTTGENSAQYWANIAVRSKNPLAPLANIPGVFAALWTPEVAPTTAFTLATAGYGFMGLPKNLVHFTTIAGARGIANSSAINATRFGLFGPGIYMTSLGRPINLFVQATAKFPISISTPAGTTRIIPYLVYVRWGLNPILLP